MINPRTILCVGRNYAAHAKELGNAIPTEPFFFLKPYSSLVFPPNPIRLPPNSLVHHEIEIGVVLNGQISRLSTEKQAIESIAGFCICCDLTARNWQEEAKGKGLPWTKAKGCDTFLPCGPFVDKKNIKDMNKIEITLKVNGVTKQNGASDLMLHSIPKLLINASNFMTLSKGDLLLTGTPSGVGPIKVGDVVTLIGLGTETSFDVKSWDV